MIIAIEGGSYVLQLYVRSSLSPHQTLPTTQHQQSVRHPFYLSSPPLLLQNIQAPHKTTTRIFIFSLLFSSFSRPTMQTITAKIIDTTDCSPPKTGDIVTFVFSYLSSQEGIPQDVRVLRIREDMTWHDVVRNEVLSLPRKRSLTRKSPEPPIHPFSFPPAHLSLSLLFLLFICFGSHHSRCVLYKDSSSNRLLDGKWRREHSSILRRIFEETRFGSASSGDLARRHKPRGSAGGKHRGKREKRGEVMSIS